jgi:hypothetical protein
MHAIEAAALAAALTLVRRRNGITNDNRSCREKEDGPCAPWIVLRPLLALGIVAAIVALLELAAMLDRGTGTLLATAGP